jgi:signal transduction histidine kinase
MEDSVTTPVPRGRLAGVAGLAGRFTAGAQTLFLGLLALAGGSALLAIPSSFLPAALLTTPLGTFTGGKAATMAHLVLAGLSVVVLLPIMIPGALLGVRLVAWLTRLLTARWCGVTIASPYRPYEEFRAEHGFGRRGRLAWLLSDPATWRDALWCGLTSGIALFLAEVPSGLVRIGVDVLVGYHPDSSLDMFDPQVRATAKSSAQIDWWMSSNTQLSVLTFTVVCMLLGLLFGRRLLAAHAGFAALLLGPTRQAELARRVRHLSETRTDALDTGAAAIRRIERDLHDGAQARLVATGMTLGAAEALLDSNPAAARALLLEAKESSAKALAELRDLVRGIHPPVLADRGLTEALRALALDLPLRVDVSGTLAGRPPAPVESAAYFAASELLANVVKHAAARQAWIDIRHTDGVLRIGVTDDGRGGATAERGSGLRGLEQRLAAFDGVLAVSSPLGGPTVVNLEIPCVLSSPKTSTSSGTV